MERKTARGMDHPFAVWSFVCHTPPGAASLGKEILGRDRTQDDWSCQGCIIVPPRKETVPLAGLHKSRYLTHAALWSVGWVRAFCLGCATPFPEKISGLLLSRLYNECSRPWFPGSPRATGPQRETSPPIEICILIEDF